MAQAQIGGGGGLLLNIYAQYLEHKPSFTRFLVECIVYSCNYYSATKQEQNFISEFEPILTQNLIDKSLKFGTMESST